MAESLTVVSLRAKRDEITAVIAAHERRLEQAKRDLHHVNATIRLFEAGDDPGEHGAYLSTRLLFKQREIATFCKALLKTEGVLDTRDLARRLMAPKGLDAGDEPLRISVTYRTTQALRHEAKRGGVVGEKGIGANVWRLASVEGRTQ